MCVYSVFIEISFVSDILFSESFMIFVYLSKGWSCYGQLCLWLLWAYRTDSIRPPYIQSRKVTYTIPLTLRQIYVKSLSEWVAAIHLKLVHCPYSSKLYWVIYMLNHVYKYIIINSNIYRYRVKFLEAWLELECRQKLPSLLNRDRFHLLLLVFPSGAEKNIHQKESRETRCNSHCM